MSQSQLPRTEQVPTDPSIVVGIDGSPAATAALRWAAGEARSHDAELTVISVVAPPATFGYPMAVVPGMDEALLQSAEIMLDEALAEVFGDKRPAKVRRVVEEGTPSRVLIDASAKATLLVVGARGHGGFLLGSVSDRCVHHANCPVVVVRD